MSLEDHPLIEKIGRKIDCRYRRLELLENAYERVLSSVESDELRRFHINNRGLSGTRSRRLDPRIYKLIFDEEEWNTELGRWPFYLTNVVTFLGRKDEAMRKLSDTMSDWNRDPTKMIHFFYSQKIDLNELSRKMLTRTLTEQEYVAFTAGVESYLSNLKSK